MRRQRARDALEDAQIGIVEREGSIQWSLSGILDTPGTECAVGDDLPGRYCVRKNTLEWHLLVDADLLQPKLMHLPHLRRLARLAGNDGQRGGIRDELLDDEVAARRGWPTRSVPR